MEKNIFIEPGRAYAEIERDWKAWNNEVMPGVYVVGISGGVDSTCVAALAVRIFGRNRVVGVSLPCDGQHDMADVNAVFDKLGIRRVTVDIGDAFNILMNGVENNAIDAADACRINMPARIRMTVLFAVAQCLGGVVVNTCNLSEDVVGYSTFGGDNMGCYAPIKGLTKTEVKSLAKWLGIPDVLADKTPVDGLQPLSDEDKLGFTYERLDRLIRCQNVEDVAFNAEIYSMFVKNRFKTDIVSIPGPAFKELPNYARDEWGMS